MAEEKVNVVGSGEGFGGSGIWAILLLALLGRHGLGGGDEGGVANIELNGRLNGIEQRIDNVTENAEIRATHEAVCTTQRDILENRYALGKDILENRYLAGRETALGFKEVELHSDRNFFETNRNIDGLKVEGLLNTQKILDALKQNEIDALKSKVAELSLGYSQQNQNAALIHALRPTAVPAYPGASPYVPANIGGFGYGLAG
jgi:hypothetical protein